MLVLGLVFCGCTAIPFIQRKLSCPCLMWFADSQSLSKQSPLFKTTNYVFYSTFGNRVERNIDSINNTSSTPGVSCTVVLILSYRISPDRAGFEKVKNSRESDRNSSKIKINYYLCPVSLSHHRNYIKMTKYLTIFPLLYICIFVYLFPYSVCHMHIFWFA